MPTAKKAAAKKAPAKKAAAAKPLEKIARKKSSVKVVPSASLLIDARIESLADWRGAMLATLRGIIKSADPGVTEDWKWEIPVWSHDGLICTGETYKEKVKLTFARGASLPDPSKLFNSSLDGGTRRAIDFGVSAMINEAALKALIRAAVALNQS